MITHIVLLKLKQGVSKQEIKEIYENVHLLKDKINGIEEITSGTNNSPEKEFIKGFTEGFVIKFKDIKARDDYLPHPFHKQVAETFIKPLIESILVYDYETINRN